MADLSGKTMLITGANAGIGFQTALALAARGAHVLITGRNPEKMAEAQSRIRDAAGHSDVDVFLADHASLDQVAAMGRQINQTVEKLDVAIYNAGAIFAQRRLSEDGFEMHFAVNHLAHFLLHQILEAKLIDSAPSRVVVVASGAHRWGRGLLKDPMSERGFSGMVAYGRSKLANILFARLLARRLKDKGVTANALHPGVIRSDLGLDGERGMIFNWGFSLIAPFVKSPAQGAQTSIHLAASPELEGQTGGYYRNMKVARTWGFASDDDAAQALWDHSNRCLDSWRQKN
jgi:NAD(P)-dependent dehydrogenase (short-subunit alcohol dehydrogenase family)